jgi:sugar phosphate isomerase/epimerase
MSGSGDDFRDMRDRRRDRAIRDRRRASRAICPQCGAGPGVDCEGANGGAHFDRVMLADEQRAFARLVETAANAQLRALSRRLVTPGQPLWKLAEVQREMARRGI